MYLGVRSPFGSFFFCSRFQKFEFSLPFSSGQDSKNFTSACIFLLLVPTLFPNDDPKTIHNNFALTSLGPPTVVVVVVTLVVVVVAVVVVIVVVVVVVAVV